MVEGPMKLKDALKLCHRSPHYGLVCDALRINDGRVQTLYQEYCTLCKAENIKPLTKDAIRRYTITLIKEGKIMQVREGYVVKKQVRAIEDRSRGKKNV